MDLITLALAKKYTNNKFAGLVKFGGFEIVEALPTEEISTSTVYLLHSTSPTEGNIYEEYIYTTEGKWESLGTTVDLEGYVTIEALNEALKTVSWNDLQDKPFGEIEGPGTVKDPGRVVTFTEGKTYYQWTYPYIPQVTYIDGHMYYVTIGTDNFKCIYSKEPFEPENEGDFYCYNQYLKTEQGDIIASFYGYYTSGWYPGREEGYVYYNKDGSFEITISEVGIITSPIEEKYIPLSIARKAYVDEKIEEAADWNRITNRPFYEDIIEGDTWSQSIYLSSGDAESGSFYLDQSPKPNQTYLITLNDTQSFECIYQELNSTVGFYTLDGQRIIFGQELGSTGPYWFDSSLALSGYYTIVFSEIEHVFKQLDEKFIPTTIARKSDIPETGTVSWDDLIDRPFGEFYAFNGYSYPLTNITFSNEGFYLGNAGDDYIDLSLYSPVLFEVDGKQYIATDITTGTTFKYPPKYDSGSEIVFDKAYTIKGENFEVRVGTNTYHYWTHIEIEWPALANKTCTINYGSTSSYPAVKLLDDKYISFNIARAYEITAIRNQINDIYTRLTSIPWNNINSKPFYRDPETVVNETPFHSYDSATVNGGRAYYSDDNYNLISLSSGTYYIKVNDGELIECRCDYTPGSEPDGFDAYFYRVDTNALVLYASCPYGGPPPSVQFYWPEDGTYSIEIYSTIPGPEYINLSALPMDAIVQAVIAALPRAEDETI